MFLSNHFPCNFPDARKKIEELFKIIRKQMEDKEQLMSQLDSSIEGQQHQSLPKKEVESRGAQTDFPLVNAVVMYSDTKDKGQQTDFAVVAADSSSQSSLSERESQSQLLITQGDKELSDTDSVLQYSQISDQSVLHDAQMLLQRQPQQQQQQDSSKKSAKPSSAANSYKQPIAHLQFKKKQAEKENLANESQLNDNKSTVSQAQKPNQQDIIAQELVKLTKEQNFMKVRSPTGSN